MPPSATGMSTVMWPAATLEARSFSPGSFISYNGLRERLRQQNDDQHYQKHVIIFGLCWIPREQGENLLAACTSHGEIIVWSPTTTTTSTTTCAATTARKDKPIFRCKVSTGKLYSIKFSSQRGKQSLLIVSGDEGVLAFDWQTIYNDHIQTPAAKSSSEPLVPVTTFHPHPSPTEKATVEVNDFELLNNGEYLLGAAGDSFGIYKWDIESGKLVANYSSPEKKGIFTLKLLPPDSGNQQPTLLAGGEGGKIHIWDTAKDKSQGTIDVTKQSGPADATANKPASLSPFGRSTSNKRAKTTSSRWISSICAFDPIWFTVAGGVGSGGNNGGKSGGSSYQGFLATYHATTRSLVSSTETREIPQQLACASLSSPSSSCDHHSLVCVANEGVVSQYNALSLETTTTTSRQWCTSPCSYAAAVSDDGNRTAVAGVGCFVDIFDSLGEKRERLQIC